MPHTTIKRKIIASDLFNCTNLSAFIASIIQILPYRGVSMSRFYLCELDEIKFLTKLCFYRKSALEIYGNAPEHVISPIEAEINILRILNDNIIGRNITPCIIELVYSKICENLGQIVPDEQVCDQLMTREGEPLLEDDLKQLICRYHDLVKNGLAHNKCAFLILDRCDMTFDEYLQKSINTSVSLTVFKSLLFQIVYTIYAITQVYPRFRHYDLHTENIMLKFDPTFKFKATSPKFLVFTVEGERHFVPYFGIIAKIIDFGFSSLPEENIVSNSVVDKERMYIRAQNDLLLLFHWIYYRLGHINGDKLNRVSVLLQQLEPNKSYIHYYTEHIRKIEDKIPTYEQMVKNPVWNDYKKHTAPKNQIYREFTAPSRT